MIGVSIRKARVYRMATFKVEFGPGVQSLAAVVYSDDVAEMIAKVPEKDRHELVQVIKEVYYSKDDTYEATVYQGNNLVAKFMSGDEFGQFMTALYRYW